jgi:predicted permease
MISELFAVIAPILAAAGVGYAWARRGLDYPVEFVTRLVMNIGAPCLIIASFSDTRVSLAHLGELALAAALVLLAMALLGTVLIRLARLPLQTFLPPSVFGNTGNMGLPLCLFAFGQPGLEMALVFFLVVFTCQMTLGMLFVAGRANLAELLRQPVLWSSVIALGLVLSGTSLPAWLANTTRLLGDLTIPMMVITLGVSLARLKVAEWRHSLSFSLLRVAGGFAVGWLVAGLLGLQGVERGVVILQSAMPVAVFNYLLALKFHRDPGEVAGTVLVSTVLSFLTLPLLVWYVL